MFPNINGNVDGIFIIWVDDYNGELYDNYNKFYDIDGIEDVEVLRVEMSDFMLMIYVYDDCSLDI